MRTIPIRISAEAYGLVISEFQKGGYESISDAASKLLEQVIKSKGPSLFRIKGEFSQLLDQILPKLEALDECGKLMKQLLAELKSIEQQIEKLLPLEEEIKLKPGYTLWLIYKERGGRSNYEEWYKGAETYIETLISPAQNS